MYRKWPFKVASLPETWRVDAEGRKLTGFVSRRGDHKLVCILCLPERSLKRTVGRKSNDGDTIIYCCDRIRMRLFESTTFLYELQLVTSGT